jgi:diamine N-acetyltransferase
MLHIRPAIPTDVPIIQELTRQIWPVTYGHILSQEQIKYMLEKMYSTTELTHQLNNGYDYLLLLEDEDPVGFAAYSSTEEPGLFRLHKIYLHPDQQGKGAGKLLLGKVITNIKTIGAHTLELNVNRHNKAKHFYEKQGFTVWQEKDIDIGNGYWMNDYIMRKVL